jgi:hypothetical protein
MKPLNLTTKVLASHVIVVLRDASTIRHTWMASTDVTWLTAQRNVRWTKHICSLRPSVSRHRTPHSRTNFDKTCQLTGTVRGTARRPHFSLAIISVAVKLRTKMFWVISAYFKIKNTLQKSGTFVLGHPVCPQYIPIRYLRITKSRNKQHVVITHFQTFRFLFLSYRRVFLQSPVRLLKPPARKRDGEVA